MPTNSVPISKSMMLLATRRVSCASYLVQRMVPQLSIDLACDKFENFRLRPGNPTTVISGVRDRDRFTILCNLCDSKPHSALTLAPQRFSVQRSGLLSTWYVTLESNAYSLNGPEGYSNIHRNLGVTGHDKSRTHRYLSQFLPVISSRVT